MGVAFGDADSSFSKGSPESGAASSLEDEQDEENVFKPCLCEQIEGGSFMRKLREQAVLRFSWFVFVKETVYHTFFPLSIPLLAYWEGGLIGLLNRQYIGSSPISWFQWFFGICFFVMNALGAFEYDVVLVIVNILWLMRNMVIGTKYGFLSQSEMREMRTRVLPKIVHQDRTLFLAWINPVPLHVLKRQLLLAAMRKDLVDFTSALRITPRVSQKMVCLIMRQLSTEPSERNSHRPKFKEGNACGNNKDRLGRKAKSCHWCASHDCEATELEARWIQICMSRFREDPERIFPVVSMEEDLDGGIKNPSGMPPSYKTVEDSGANLVSAAALDLPSLMYTAYLLQQSSALLSKKKIFHQIIGHPKRVWVASYVLAVCHSSIPVVAKAIAGKLPVFGHDRWYNYVVAISSFVLDVHAMSFGIAFMLAGAADFRRRYFAAKLLNGVLKDGQFEEETSVPRRKMSAYQLGVTVDFEEPASIVGWWAMRVLVRDFGMVFYMRVKYYATYFSVYCGLLLAFLIVIFLSKSTPTATYLLPLVIYDLVVFVILLALIVFPAGETNEMYQEHGATLVRKKMLLKKRLNKSVGANEALTYTVDFIQTVSEAVEWENISSNVTILGFNKGHQVVYGLVSVAAVGIGIAAQQFTSKVTSLG